ncbi:MAG: hypothetical protein ABH872_04905 [Candidatus Omnitrophota bacterium]
MTAVFILSLILILSAKLYQVFVKTEELGGGIGFVITKAAIISVILFFMYAFVKNIIHTIFISKKK